MVEDPHAETPTRTAGPDPVAADAAVVALHGRGASARSILTVAEELAVDGVHYRAPAAARSTWYPRPFTQPIDQNEPWLSSALGRVASELEALADAGLSRDRVVLLGFSQGACLSTEYVARNATEYGGVVAFSGGLIGPDDTPREYDGSLAGTDVFVGCSDRDPHIPLERVHETSEVLEELGADVDERIYEGMGHSVNDDELEAAASLVEGVANDQD